MRYALVALIAVTFVALAGEFATGGSELWKFKGYSFATAYMYGMEDADPDMEFFAMTDLAWLPMVNDYLDAKVEAKLYSYDGVIHLEDVYLNLHFSDQVCLQGGQFKQPIGYGYLESGSGLRFLHRPLYTDYAGFGIYGGRDIGFGLLTDFGMGGIDLTYTNGSGANQMENDSNKMVHLHGWAMPAEWVEIGGSFAMYSADDPADTTETFSTNGFGGYAVVDYPASPSIDVGFIAEYLSLGWWGPEVTGTETKSAGIYTVELNANFGVENAWILTGVQPAVRYEQVDPATQLPEGAGDPEDNYGAIDFCLNLHMTSMNTLQIGARNYSYEFEDMDGYTDIYLNWRMKF
ncbi:hypothetical protein JW921_01065 [Candidatus Fermentibacterales bacterium]|nr:hypothetical protein [Candidatus Fermentibacterales bacterium]